MSHRASDIRPLHIRRTRRLRSASVLVFLLLLAALPALGVDVTVGSGADCDFADLQSAIDAVEAQSRATIRIAAVQLNSVSVGIAPTGDLVIAGGFDSCSSPESDGETDLLGTFLDRTVTIDGPATASVEFRDVFIAQGSALEGGGILARGGVRVLLVRAHVSGNDAERGGGVSLQGGSLSLSEATISSNRAVLHGVGPIRGGGVHCTDGGRIQVRSSSMIVANSADGGAGGGLFLSNGCEFDVLSSAAGAPSEIDSNRAASGGGVFAKNSAILLRGGLHSPVLVRRNRAESASGVSASGGGILLTLGASLVAENTLFEANLANGGKGGALALFAGAHAKVTRSLGPEHCHTADRCSRIAENVADRGAAAVVNGSNSLLEIEGTYVEGNVGLESVIEVDFFGSVRTAGTVLGENVAPRLVRLDADGHGRFLFTTVAANDLSTGTEVFEVSDGAELELLASIVFEPEVDILGNFGGTADVRCVLASEVSSLAGGLEVEQGSPAFVQAPIDYHLIDVSEAIDFCSPSLVVESPLDLDLAPRGFDAPNDDRGFGTFLDLGADEFGSGEGTGEVIFLNGFESGDLSDWNQSP